MIIEDQLSLNEEVVTSQKQQPHQRQGKKSKKRSQNISQDFSSNQGGDDADYEGGGNLFSFNKRDAEDDASTVSDTSKSSDEDEIEEEVDTVPPHLQYLDNENDKLELEIENLGIKKKKLALEKEQKNNTTKEKNYLVGDPVQIKMDLYNLTIAVNMTKCVTASEVNLCITYCILCFMI